jgi:hypothetical protein
MVDTLQAYTRNFRVVDWNRWTKHTTTNRGTGEEATKESCNLEIFNATIFPQSNRLNFHTSLPKLLYGSSLWEVKETDKDKLIELIQKKLFDECGVSVSEGLEDFKLSRVDFCKNVPVEHHPTDYISSLNQFKYSRREKANYKNETLSFRNTRRELTFYDKVEEVSRQEKNEEIKKIVSTMPHNILRVETRFRNSSVVKKEFGDKSLMFVMSDELAREKLCREFDGLVRAEGEQLEFDFNGNLELINEIKKSRCRNVFGKFLEVKGLRVFLAECCYDWKRVESVMRQACNNRFTVYKWMRRLQSNQALVLVEKDRQLIREIRDKLRKVA